MRERNDISDQSNVKEVDVTIKTSIKVNREMCPSCCLYSGWRDGEGFCYLFQVLLNWDEVRKYSRCIQCLDAERSKNTIKKKIEIPAKVKEIIIDRTGSYCDETCDGYGVVDEKRKCLFFDSPLQATATCDGGAEYLRCPQCVNAAKRWESGR